MKMVLSGRSIRKRGQDGKLNQCREVAPLWGASERKWVQVSQMAKLVEDTSIFLACIGGLTCVLPCAGPVSSFGLGDAPELQPEFYKS